MPAVRRWRPLTRCLSPGEAFGDGILNSEEAATSSTITGNSGVNGACQTVNMLISGLNGDQPFSATVQTDGSWSLALSPEQLATLTNGSHTITVTASDVAGNTDSTTLAVVTAAVTPPTPTFTDGALEADNLLNISEAVAGVTLTGTIGSVGG